MIWFLAALLLLTGCVMIGARRPLARAQALLFGGTIAPGCVIAEAVILFALALLALVLRRVIE